jgi:hypothetical protein
VIREFALQADKVSDRGAAAFEDRNGRRKRSFSRQAGNAIASVVRITSMLRATALT